MSRAELISRAHEAYANGILAYCAGEANPSCALLATARGLFIQIGKSQVANLAICNSALGDAHMQTHRYSEAAIAYRDARTYYVDHHLPEKVAACDQNLGTVYSSMGRYAEAITAHQDARAYYLDHDFPEDVAACDQNLGTVYSRMGRHLEAITAYQAARSFYLNQNTLENVARCDAKLGKAYSVIGRYREAIAAFQAARTYYRALTRPEKTADNDSALGRAYSETGQYVEAITALQNARELYRIHGFPEHIADCDLNLGVVYEKIGRYPEALGAYQSARSYFLAHDLLDRVARCDHNVGVVLEMVGRYPEALAAHVRYRDYFANQRLPEQVAHGDVFVARVTLANAGASLSTPEHVRLLSQAAERVIPAALYVDSLRFSLPRTGERLLWSRQVTGPVMRAAFKIAQELGDSRLISELIVSTRSTGSFATTNSEFESDSLSIPESVDLLDMEATEAPSRGSDVASSATSVAVRLLGGDRLRLNPPPHTRTAYSVALLSHLKRAQTSYSPSNITSMRTAKTVDIFTGF